MIQTLACFHRPLSQNPHDLSEALFLPKHCINLFHLSPSKSSVCFEAVHDTDNVIGLPTGLTHGKLDGSEAMIKMHRRGRLSSSLFRALQFQISTYDASQVSTSSCSIIRRPQDLMRLLRCQIAALHGSLYYAQQAPTSSLRRHDPPSRVLCGQISEAPIGSVGNHDVNRTPVTTVARPDCWPALSLVVRSSRLAISKS